MVKARTAAVPSLESTESDRSALPTRYIAKNMVAAGLCDEVLASGLRHRCSRPVGLYVNTYGTAKVNKSDGDTQEIEKLDMRPYAIERRFKFHLYLRRNRCLRTHGSRALMEKVFVDGSGKEKKVKVKLFPWEELDYVAKIKKSFKL